MSTPTPTAEKQEAEAKPLFETKHIENRPTLVSGQDITFSTVFADKIMLSLDKNINTVTLTLLQCHTIPRINPKQNWELDNTNWTIAGEIKVPHASFRNNCYLLHWTNWKRN